MHENTRNFMEDKFAIPAHVLPPFALGNQHGGRHVICISFPQGDTRLQLIEAKINLHVSIIVVSHIVSVLHVVHFKVPCTSLFIIRKR